jgi:putative mRNA 3-end processing factor
LPIYRWKPQELVAAEINAWWSSNAERGIASVLMGYSLGKAQRLLAMIDPSIGPIVAHGSIAPLNAIYRAEGIFLPVTKNVLNLQKEDVRTALVLAPPSALGTSWIKRFGNFSDAFASGWMSVRGAKRRRSIDRGFVVSDHVDWPSLLESVQESGAERVWLTHGYSSVVARYLKETRGLDARVLSTEWEGESLQETGESELSEGEVLS